MKVSHPWGQANLQASEESIYFRKVADVAKKMTPGLCNALARCAGPLSMPTKKVARRITSALCNMGNRFTTLIDPSRGGGSSLGLPDPTSTIRRPSADLMKVASCCHALLFQSLTTLFETRCITQNVSGSSSVSTALACSGPRYRFGWADNAGVPRRSRRPREAHRSRTIHRHLQMDCLSA